MREQENLDKGRNRKNKKENLVTSTVFHVKANKTKRRK